MAEPETTEQPELWDAVGALFATGAFPGVTADGVADIVLTAGLKSIPGVIDVLEHTVQDLARLLGTTLVAVEEPFLPILGAFAAPIVGGLFGTEPGEGPFSSRADREGRRGAAAEIVDAYMNAIVGDTANEVQPSDDGARRIAGAAVHAVLEGWFNEMIPEVLSDVLPFGLGHFTAFTGLSEEVIQALGIGRLVRRAFSPLIDATAAVPMRWKVNKLYRHSELSLSQLGRALMGGWIEESEYVEAVARLGYTDIHARAVLAESQKRNSVTDYELLERFNRGNRAMAIQALKEEGYDLPSAENEVDLLAMRRALDHDRSIATAAVDAYVNGRIDRNTLDQYASAPTFTDAERDNYIELADARRLLKEEPLTPSETEACVKIGILAVSDYRDALRRAGRTEDAVTALELKLRHELDDRVTMEEHRAAAEADRAREQAARQAAADAARAAREQAAALKRRGPASDLERAVVRGLIPIARYREVLTESFDADTVDILTSLVEDERQKYVMQQAAAAAAAQRAGLDGLNVADLRAAVKANLLSVAEFRARLVAGGTPDAAADLLASTLQAQLDDAAAAEQAREQARQAAAVKSIDLGRFELLVRRGVRPMSDYVALLGSLGFDESSIAAMRDALQIHIDDDQAAADRAAVAAEAARSKGLSLDQIKRAVVLGVKTRDQYQAWLLQNGFTADATDALLALSDADVAEAESARRRRVEAGTSPDARRVPLSTLHDAARLGVVAPGVYQQRLVEAGYTSDDIAIELALLTTEIADTQAARQRRAMLDASLPDQGLGLTQLARAVRLGVTPIEAYHARALELGYPPDDAAVLVDVLDHERQTTHAAQARQLAIQDTPTASGGTLGAVHDAVVAGAATVATYRAALTAAELPAEDIPMLTALVADEAANRGT